MEGVCALRHGWSTFRRLRTKRARVQQTPSSTRVQYPLGRRPMRPPRDVHLRVRGTDRCMSISLHSGTKHARRRSFGLNSLDGTIPAALSALNLLSFLCARPVAPCRAVRVRASACPSVSVRTPACARTHRRTALRVPSPHVTVSTLAAAPLQWPSAMGYSVSLAVPPRVLVLCASTTPRRSFHARAHEYPASTPPITPVSTQEDGPLLRLPFQVPYPRRGGGARARTAPQRTRSPYARESPPSTLRPRCEKG